MADVVVRPVRPGDEDEAVRMVTSLWPHHDPGEARAEMEAYIAGRPPTAIDGAVFVAERSGDGLCGFVEMSLRSVAEGCWDHSPVGYVEGWWVDGDVRQQGVGRMLVAAGEDWCRERGCVELASDAELDDTLSQTVHGALGFEEVERSVHYRKPLA